jgi:hypothetical protein
VTLQALTSLALLVREFRRRLGAQPAAAGGAAAHAGAVAPGADRN